MAAKRTGISGGTRYTSLLRLWEEREPGCQLPFTTELWWWVKKCFCFAFLISSSAVWLFIVNIQNMLKLLHFQKPKIYTGVYIYIYIKKKKPSSTSTFPNDTGFWSVTIVCNRSRMIGKEEKIKQLCIRLLVCSCLKKKKLNIDWGDVFSV